MKKLILLSASFCMISFFSCKEENKKTESFAEIIKNDPSRKQELLDVAATLKDTQVQQDIISLDTMDALDSAELANFRAKGGHADPHDKVYPAIIVSSMALKELIGSSDSLVFFLGKYPQADRKRIRRYNARNQGQGNPYSYAMLGHRFTLAIQAMGGPHKFLIGRAYDIGRLCPPPNMGCRLESAQP